MSTKSSLKATSVRRPLAYAKWALVLLTVFAVALPIVAQNGARLEAADTSDGSVQATGQTAPGISCPADYPNLVAGPWTAYPPPLSNALIWGWINEISAGFNLAEPVNGALQVWSVVGHPEAGCPGGSDPLCDPVAYPDQLNEHFNIFVDGAFKFYAGDPGDHQYVFHGNIPIGTVAAGAHTITFAHAGNDGGNVSGPSVGFIVGLCGASQDTGWDKSSLQFVGQCTGDCSQVSATVCNYGDRSMTGPSTWELFYAPSGNPKNGSMIASGTINPLAAGACQALSYDPGGISGNYMFKAYQRPGHPGTGELWSEACGLACAVAPAAAPQGDVQPQEQSDPVPAASNPGSGNPGKKKDK